MKIRPVILSGGAGMRLWPLSRAHVPKQFVPLTAPDPMLITTLRVVADRTKFLPPLIVGNTKHKFLIQDALELAGIKDASVILEPVGRNTAAACLAAALHETDNETLHLIMPSDHVVDARGFVEAILSAAPQAAKGYFVLFGIKPDYAETGYGYIQAASPLSGDTPVCAVKAFREKPDITTAESLIADGAFWNSGIFLYPPRLLIEEAKILAPELVAQIQKALTESTDDGRGLQLQESAYAVIDNQPLDRVIMEKTAKGAVLPCHFAWSDVGSWDSLWRVGEKDAHLNVAKGNVILESTHGSYVRSDGPAVCVLGMHDVAVVATKDAVLVTPRSQAQGIKQLVETVRKHDENLTEHHPRARRPWGSFESISQGPNFQVKLITVSPGRSLSLQMHHHRAEHWVVVVGTAIVQCGEVEKTVRANESVYIPKETKHRLTNPGSTDLHLIEVQSGDYLGEDDIVRFEDNYGRAGTTT